MPLSLPFSWPTQVLWPHLTSRQFWLLLVVAMPTCEALLNARVAHRPGFGSRLCHAVDFVPCELLTCMLPFLTGGLRWDGMS